MGFTQKTLRALKPSESTFEVGDGTGLRCRVTSTGIKSFIWTVKHEGKQTTITIGRFPDMGPDEAAEVLTELKKAHRLGKLGEHPLVSGKRTPGVIGSGSDTVEAVFSKYLTHLQRKGRETDQVEGLWERDLLDAIGSLAPHAVVKAHARTVRDNVYERARKRQEAAPEGVETPRGDRAAQRAIQLGRQFFSWATDEGHIVNEAGKAIEDFPNPFAITVDAPPSAQRLILHDEFAPIWNALDRLSPVMRDAARFLMLVPLRTQELRLATWDRVDLVKATLTIPPEHLKTRGESSLGAWVVPLPPSALAILRTLKARADLLGSPYVLASDRVGPAAGEGDAERKKRGEPYSRTNLVAKVSGLFEGENALKLPGGPVSPHDFRRACRTGLARLRIAPHVAKRCLDHATPGEDVDERVYTHYDYLDERREALEAWDRYVQAALAGDDEVTAKAKARPEVFGKVVPIRGRRGAKAPKRAKAGRS